MPASDAINGFKVRSIMASANSLRDLYSPQSPPWSFLPADPTSHNSSPSSSHQWSTRPNRSPLFDLAPALDIDSATSARSLAEASNALLLTALALYTSTAIAMPWEVGKMLLQVQWVPKDTLSDEREPEGVAFDDVDDGEVRPTYPKKILWLGLMSRMLAKRRFD
jgi:mitochondrial fusion and transport protein UGO1